MPGISKLLKNSNENPKRDKLCSFVQKYWHFDNISKMSHKQFTRSYLTWAKNEGYRLNESKAQDIYALSQNGIPSMNSKTPSTKMIVLESIRLLCEVETTIDLLLSRMIELAQNLLEYEIVRSMGGVGEKLTPQIIASIGDIRSSAKALIAYAGIDAPPYQSGSYIGTQQKISKRGSKYLRKIGYEIMMSIKCTKPTTDTAVYDYIIKKENEGKPKKIVKIAGLNKFLRIYYARVNEIYCNMAIKAY